MNYCAIDFETATNARNSACSVAVVDVVDGVMKDSFYTLIQPPENKYNYDNIQIHGIKPADTANAPTFAEIWPELRLHLENKIVLAHNATFDMGVLRYCINDFHLKPVNFTEGCTLKLARAVWPHLERHKLNCCADYMGIDFKHHDALEDSRTCAAIPLKAAKERGLSSVREIFSAVRIPLKPFR